MLLSRLVVTMLSIGVMVAGAGVVSSQDYPSRPIRIIAGTVGGGNDKAARIIAQGISGPLGQPVVIDNVAGGSIGSATAGVKAPPDGHTLLVIGVALWVTPLLQKTPSYDVVTDFSPISQIIRGVSIVTVHPSVPVKSVRELIAFARARPGELNFAANLLQFATGLFKSMAEIKIVEVPYKGGPAAITAALSGEVHAIIHDLALVAPNMESGKLRALAVTSATPSLAAPELPTVAASGLPGYEYVGVTGIYAPAKTPAAIINRINREIVRVLILPEVKERFLSAGEEVVASSPQKFAATIKSDIAKTAKLIKDAGIRAE